MASVPSLFTLVILLVLDVESCLPHPACFPTRFISFVPSLFTSLHLPHCGKSIYSQLEYLLTYLPYARGPVPYIYIMPPSSSSSFLSAYPRAIPSVSLSLQMVLHFEEL